MKNFTCDCGQILFFENRHCLQCGKQVGFDPLTLTMSSNISGVVENFSTTSHRLCKNSEDYNVCNWFVSDPADAYCISCELNHTIPNLMQPDRRRWWRSLEHAKRRLIYSLLSLKLPVIGKRREQSGLAFEFIEDKRTNPGVLEEHVNTGHRDGLITINITEADDVRREISRQYTGELYRTLLGHFRHESGHYYFNRLVKSDPTIEKFRQLFGDETVDYASALEYYYANKLNIDRDPDLISHYAQSHPLEDWAEVWAHYLHMVDTLETAAAFQLRQGAELFDEFNEKLVKWSKLSIMLNSLNRSMGLEDAYPFILSDLALKKLRFVHGLICPS